jgi:hypothetical protein
MAREIDGGLGYPAKAAFLTIGAQRSVRTDPTEFSAKDYRELDEALAHLLAVAPGPWHAMRMYYLPWAAENYRREGWPFGNSTYYARLHVAHRAVAEFMDREKKVVEPLVAAA